MQLKAARQQQDYRMGMGPGWAGDWSQVQSSDTVSFRGIGPFFSLKCFLHAAHATIDVYAGPGWSIAVETTLPQTSYESCLLLVLRLLACKAVL
jgi:hypothetical protein